MHLQQKLHSITSVFQTEVGQGNHRTACKCFYEIPSGQHKHEMKVLLIYCLSSFCTISIASCPLSVIFPAPSLSFSSKYSWTMIHIANAVNFCIIHSLCASGKNHTQFRKQCKSTGFLEVKMTPQPSSPLISFSERLEHLFPCISSGFAV